MKQRIISILLVFALMVATMAVGPAAMAHNGKGKHHKKPKVTICHNAGQTDQETIRVRKSVARGHVAHGDSYGACQTLPPPPPPPP